MKYSFQKLDAKTNTLIRKVAREAGSRGLSLYLVGGVVRDILLKKKNLDLDFVLEGDAIEFAKYLADKWNKEIRVYPVFKTATIYLGKGLCIDFASARKETYSKPGALPTVKFSTLRDDLLRRDFTVNALAISLVKDNFGLLVDYCAGLKDLKEKKIRMLHQKSFLDDPTRILRAIRFEQRLGFKLEPLTLRLLKKAIRARYDRHVSADRYFFEFEKILAEERPSKAIDRLKGLKGFIFIDPKFSPDTKLVKSVERQLIRSKGVDTEKRLEMILLAIFEGQPLAVRKKAIAQWPIKKGLKKSFLQLGGLKDIIYFLNRKQVLSSDIYTRLKGKEECLLDYLLMRIEKQQIRRKLNKYCEHDRYVTTFLKGADLKKEGIASGKRLGEILEKLKLMKIDGKLRTRADELKELKRLLGRP